ncbi:MAG: hypothetical protein HC828_19615 [Blastochloris sp.]|nr:hypothetical protein [Blastochloris sp.]
MWFDGFGATEFAIASGRYDMVLSLLILADAVQRGPQPLGGRNSRPPFGS